MIVFALFATFSVVSKTGSHPTGLQGDIRKLQVATASGAQVCELTGPARSRALALVNDAVTQACVPEAEGGPAQSPAQLREGSGSGSGSGNGGEVQVTVLHAACSTRSVALVEFIWQVRVFFFSRLRLQYSLSVPATYYTAEN